MTNIYAKVGESFVQQGGNMPEGFIEMQGPRPEVGEWVAKEDGTWILQSLHEQATNVQLTKREFLKLVIALTKDTPNPITLALIESYVAAATDDIRLEWDYATYVERKHPLLDTVSASFGISPELLDIMFVNKDDLLHKIDNALPLHE